MLENDVKLKAQKAKKPKSTTVDFNNFSNSDSDSDSDDTEPEPVQKPKQWGTSTRNKRSIKKAPQPIKVVETKYQEPVYF